MSGRLLAMLLLQKDGLLAAQEGRGKAGGWESIGRQVVQCGSSTQAQSRAVATPEK